MAQPSAPAASNTKTDAPTKVDMAVAVFPTHDLADEAIKQLQKAGFKMANLSIIGKDYQTEEHPIGFFNVADQAKFWGKKAAFWGSLVGILTSSAFLVVPVLGHIIVLGPLVSSLIGALEGAAVGGGVGALWAALGSWGVPENSVIRYQDAVKAGKFVVFARGTPDEISRAKSLLAGSKAEALDNY